MVERLFANSINSNGVMGFITRLKSRHFIQPIL